MVHAGGPERDRFQGVYSLVIRNKSLNEADLGGEFCSRVAALLAETGEALAERLLTAGERSELEGGLSGHGNHSVRGRRNIALFQNQNARISAPHAGRSHQRKEARHQAAEDRLPGLRIYGAHNAAMDRPGACPPVLAAQQCGRKYDRKYGASPHDRG